MMITPTSSDVVILVNGRNAEAYLKTNCSGMGGISHCILEELGEGLKVYHKIFRF